MEKTRCNVCGKFLDTTRCYVCEKCGNEHHPQCSGENSAGSGEYPDEEAYSICKKCK
jgi:hypothetical protein